MNTSKYVEALAVLALGICVSADASAQEWASTATKAFPVQNIPGATLVGPLAATTTVHVVLGLQTQNASQIQPTLQAMITPGNPLNGTSLTLQQFVTQFGPTSVQVQAAENYLTSMGFTDITVADNQLLIDGYAPASNVEAAFNTSLAEYSINGASVFANTAAAQVPASLSGIVIAVLGLNNIASLHPDIARLSLAPMTVPCTPPQCPTPALANESYGAEQYQIAYDAACPSDNPNCPAKKFPTGSNTVVGIIAEGDLTQVVTDLRTYEKANELPEVPVTVVNAGIASSDTSGADEWDLDSQTSTGIAQQVSHLYFYVATSMTDSDLALAISKAVSQNKVKAFNMSFGECEFLPYIDGSMLVDDEVFAEAALQGITPFASADDNGSACPAEATNGVPLSGPPDTAYPASSPYVIAVGGTNLFTNADFTYDFETAWEASGGGISYFETAPFWQSYTGGGTTPIVPSAEVGQRGVPDVSMCAGGSEYAICAANIIVDGTATLVGGTSLSSPLAMGSWARIESAHKNKLGFAAPLIYQLATSGPPPSSPDFNDVILGGNGLFTALPGYDYVTGLGSFDIYKVSQLIPSTYPQ
ncbi:MAG TPA: S53 family peptidase [Bryobacteraceae bacterium]|nr:S53 family peptidase [Bryobacteraceae bacterium]